MRDTMTNRERYNAAFRRQAPDRVPLWEACYWPETLERWRQEGLPPDANPLEYLDMDPFVNLYVDTSLRLPVEPIQETDEFTLTRNEVGVIKQSWKTKTATPHEVDWTIKTRADWERHRERLLDDQGRITPEILEGVKTAHRDAVFSTISLSYEPAWFAIMALGYEHSMVALGEDPDWIEEMALWQAELNLRMIQALVDADAVPDGIFYWSDLCYRNGMLFSPRTYRERFMPLHQRVADLCHEHGMLLLLHCCGRVVEILPLLIEGGFDVIEPLEARCGNDVRELKPLYGDRVAFFGNIAVDVLARGPEAAEAEVRSKVPVAMAGGGYAFTSDHSVPPTVSWEAYRRAVEVCKEIGRS